MGVDVTALHPIGINGGRPYRPSLFFGGELPFPPDLILRGRGHPNISLPSPPHEGRDPRQQHHEHRAGAQDGGAAQDRGQHVPHQGLEGGGRAALVLRRARVRGPADHARARLREPLPREEVLLRAPLSAGAALGAPHSVGGAP